jgi:N-acetylmuramoyl-L-alanine amidase
MTAMIDRPSPNTDDRPPGVGVSMLVLHYTGMTSAEAAVARLTDPAARVSAHYVIDEAGRVFRLAGEDRRCWHAGAGAWRGQDDVNARSIGVEIANPGHEHGYRPFPEAQMAAVTDLARAIVNRHAIRPEDVVGHSDTAPERKEDPGELFDWARLARAGVGLWPFGVGAAVDGPVLGVGDAGIDVLRLQRDLARFGWTVEPTGRFDRRTERVVVAFQRRFRQQRLDGRFDRLCRARLDWLLTHC